MTDNIPNRGPELLGVNWFFAISALLAVLMRCYVRIGIVKKFGLDDWMMAAATVCDSSHRLFLFPTRQAIVGKTAGYTPVPALSHAKGEAGLDIL